MIIAISAMTKDRVIGKDNWLPWDIPQELNMFRRLTQGSTVIMGRKTYDSIGRLMPKRNNIIISRNPDLKIEGADVCNSIEAGLQKAKTYGQTIFVIGGAYIYKASLPHLDKMYLSFIKKDYEGDTYFPKFNKDEWEVEKREDHDEFEFVVYRRVST